MENNYCFKESKDPKDPIRAGWCTVVYLELQKVCPCCKKTVTVLHQPWRYMVNDYMVCSSCIYDVVKDHDLKSKHAERTSIYCIS
jgi:hypothetical protein